MIIYCTVWYLLLVLMLRNVYVTQGGHLYLADRRITWIRYFKTVRHISSIFAYHNKHIYVFVFVCFVFVIYYDIQVHFHIIYSCVARPSSAQGVIACSIYKRPLSEGLAQFTGFKFTRITSGRWVLINPRDQLGTTYNCNFHGRYASMAEHGSNRSRLKASIKQQSATNWEW